MTGVFGLSQHTSDGKSVELRGACRRIGVRREEAQVVRVGGCVDIRRPVKAERTLIVKHIGVVAGINAQPVGAKTGIGGG